MDTLFNQIQHSLRASLGVSPSKFFSHTCFILCMCKRWRGLSPYADTNWVWSPLPVKSRGTWEGRQPHDSAPTLLPPTFQRLPGEVRVGAQWPGRAPQCHRLWAAELWALRWLHHTCSHCRPLCTALSPHNSYKSHHMVLLSEPLVLKIAVFLTRFGGNTWAKWDLPEKILSGGNLVYLESPRHPLNRPLSSLCLRLQTSDAATCIW